MTRSLSRRNRTLLLIAIISVFFSLPLCGQNAQLSGLVSDSSGAVIAHAKLELEQNATHTIQHSESNAEGLYLFSAVPSGTYSLHIAADGFESRVVQGIAAEVAGHLSLNINLLPGSVSNTVTVDGRSALIETSNATVSTVVNQQFVQNIPLNGRSLQSLVTANSSVVLVPTTVGAGYGGEFSVNGQRSEGNYFTVDGVSANNGQTATTQIGYGSGYSGSVPALTALGTTHSLISLDALDEFRASTSTYTAEYGRSAGGQFSFVSRAGTSSFHGSLYEYLRNAVFDANAYFNKNNSSALFARPKENQNDLGATLGGPLARLGFGHNSFFFASYEGLRLRVPQAASMKLVPSATLRTSVPDGMKPFLNTFPLPQTGSVDRGNGLVTYYSSYSTPSTINAGSIRFDRTIGERTKAFVRFSDTPSNTVSRYTSNLAIQMPTDVNVKTLTGGLDTTITSHQLNSLRINSTWNDSFSVYRSTNYGGATPLAVTDVTGLDAGSQINFYMTFDTPNALLILKNQKSEQRQFNLTDTYTIALGRHNLRFGGDYRRLHNNMSLPSVWEITTFSAASQVTSGKPASGQVRLFSGSMQPVYNNSSLYVQDEWAITPRLNLSAGLRWDHTPAPTDAGGVNPYTITTTDITHMAVEAKNTPLWKTSWLSFAPRVAIAYRVHTEEGKQTVLRTGWGLYYDMGNPQGSTGYLGVGIAAIGSFNGQSYPFTLAQINSVGSPSVAAPYSATVFGFDPDLKMPRTQQYNVSIEQQLGATQNFTLSWVGTSSDRLLTAFQYYPSRVGNTNFSSTWPAVITSNRGNSNYNALQATYHRTLSRGLQALVSYTWAHAIDNATSNYTIYNLVRANSDYDIRNNFQGTFTWDIPTRFSQRTLKTVLGAWSIDGRISSRSGMPVDVTQTSSIDPSTGQTLYLHPNRVSGQSLYVSDKTAPGGRIINSAVFTPVSTEGNAGRNIARGFAIVQTDMTLHKEFPLGSSAHLQFRAEAFNLLNKANFGTIYNTLTASGSSWTSTSTSTFGRAYNTLNDQLGGLTGIYQQGGPRSMQLALRVQF